MGTRQLSFSVQHEFNLSIKVTTLKGKDATYICLSWCIFSFHAHLFSSCPYGNQQVLISFHVCLFLHVVQALLNSVQSCPDNGDTWGEEALRIDAETDITSGVNNVNPCGESTLRDGGREIDHWPNAHFWYFGMVTNCCIQCIRPEDKRGHYTVFDQYSILQLSWYFSCDRQLMMYHMSYTQ